MTLLALAFLTVAALYLLEWACRLRRRHVETAMALRDRFFTSAEILVRDPETPESIVELLEACVNSITRPEVGRLVLRRALHNRLPRAEIEAGDDEESERFLQDVYGMRAELRRALADAAMQYAQAASFNNALLGWLVRRLSVFWLSGPANGQSAAARPLRPNERLMIDITPKLIANQNTAP